MSSPNQQLERSFRAVVVALDGLPEAEARDFLARLVLVLADELGDAARFEGAVGRALAPVAAGTSA